MLAFIFAANFFALLGALFLFARRLYSVSVVVLFYVAIVVYSVIGLLYFDYAKEAPWGFYYKVNDASLLTAALVYSSFSLSLVFGALFVGRNSFGATLLNAEGGILDKIYRKYWLVAAFFALIPSFFLVISFGFGTLWARSGYDIEGWAVGSIIARVFLPLSAIALVFISVWWVRWILFLMLYLSFFSLTSRAVVMVPFFYFIGCYFFSGKFSFLRFFVCSVFAVVGVVSALGFRLNPEQGLLPNLAYLFTGGLMGGVILEGLNYVLSYSLSYMAYMIQFVAYDERIFWLSINPMPSSLIDIKYVIDYARVAPRIPYAALGEMYLMLGWYSSILFMFLGFIFSKTEKFLVSKSLLFWVLFVVLVVSSGLMATQYNLRGASRLIYYAFFVFLACFGWRFFVYVLHSGARSYND